MTNATVVKADDWEALFIDMKCVKQGHTLNQGQERLLYFIDSSIYYNFDITEVEFKKCTEDYMYNYLENAGNFPDHLSEVELEDN